LARPKSSKILIKHGEKLHAFMRAYPIADGSVLMEFLFEGKEKVQLVLDEELGEVRPTQIVTEESIGQLKISFHSSGQFKLMAKMGKSEDSIDRATIDGPPLKDIDNPRHMLEILFMRDWPLAIAQTTERDTERDIVLDATSAPNKPFRCTVSCMSRTRFEELLVKEHRFVDTSVWETTHALESDTHVWVWTLRVSRNDEESPNQFILFLIGPVKWGKKRN